MESELKDTTAAMEVWALRALGRKKRNSLNTNCKSGFGSWVDEAVCREVGGRGKGTEAAKKWCVKYWGGDPKGNGMTELFQALTTKAVSDLESKETLQCSVILNGKDRFSN